jgi:hypothetical protein
MSLTGKGYYIWNVNRCENGDPNQIAAVAKQANLTHVLVKVADGAFPFNIDLDSGYDYARSIVGKLQSINIQVWGWQFVYGNYPDQEAEIAITRTLELGLNGFVVDAESHYEDPAKAPAASRYMNILRSSLGSLPIALSSFRYPSYHRSFPWENFLDRCDFNMPQVYWMQSHNNAGEQLMRSVNEFRNMRPFRPIIPTGPTFKQDGWIPYEAEIIEFLQVAQQLNLPAVNFWYWEGCRRDMPQFWDLISAYNYGETGQQVTIASNFVSALNNKNINEVLDFYLDNAVHVCVAGAIQGKQAIRTWVETLIQAYPENEISLISAAQQDDTVSYRWEVKNQNGIALEGRDTIGLKDDKIRFHYSFTQKPVSTL